MKFVLMLLLCGAMTYRTMGEVDVFDDFEDDIQLQLGSTKVADPLESVNRGLFWVNDKLYFYALKPVSVGYKTVMPEPVRKSVNNFFKNLGFPKRVVNNLLQMKWSGAAKELRNFTFNSTAGVLGLFNVAENHYKWQAYDEDFGQTLGYYGAGPWMAVHLPILGPCNLRDSIGLVPDMFLNPVYYIDSWGVSLSITSGDVVNQTSLRIGMYEEMKASNLDPYRFMQDAYEQNRSKKLEE